MASGAQRSVVFAAMLLVLGVSLALWVMLGGAPGADEVARRTVARESSAGPPDVESAQGESAARERHRVQPSRERVKRGASEEAVADAVRELTALAELRRQQQLALEAEKRRLRALAPEGSPPPVGDAKDGPFVSFHTDGAVYREGFFVDGKRHGLWSETFPSGGRTETEYRLGEKHGREVAWRADGSTKFLGEYRDGQIHGTWTAWHENGVVAMTRTFVDGQLQGVLRRFHENGVLAEESWFDADLEEGLNRGWHDNGTLAWENVYAAGKRNGRATWWYPDGGVETEATYVDGKFDGAYVAFHPNGDVKERRTYDHGDLIDAR